MKNIWTSFALIVSLIVFPISFVFVDNVLALPSIKSGQKIKYIGRFENATYNLTGSVFIEIVFKENNELSGYINFTNNPGERAICGAGNFQGTVKERNLQIYFNSNDPDPGCNGYDRILKFIVNANLSLDGSRLENGTYQINNAQSGIFQADSGATKIAMSEENTILSRPRREAQFTSQRPRISPTNQSQTTKSLNNNSAPTNVYKIANQTTVLIEGKNSGSGVIFSKSGNNYFVLTANHVVATKESYMIVAPDGRKRFNIDYSRVKRFKNLDLAILEFTSKDTYPLAQLGKSEDVNQGDIVFVSGWPAVVDAITKASHLVTEGRISGFQKGDADGYELLYTNSTAPGMSGGPVFDSSGRMVGIHGRAAGNPESGKVGINLGIPIHLFLQQVPQTGLSLQKLGLRSEK